MRRILLALCVCLLATTAAAGDSGWKLKGLVGANLNITGVSTNWKGDEKDSRSWLMKLEASAEMDATRVNWLTFLKEEFGSTKLGEEPEEDSADLIFFDSVFKLKMSPYVNPYIAFNMETQNSEFLDPVTYTESAGVGFDIVRHEKQNLKTRVGFAYRQRYDYEDDCFSTTDNPATAVIEEDRLETGAEWITNYDVLLTESSKYSTESRVFSAFEGGASLRWDNSLYFKIGEYITAQVGYLLIYDYDKNIKPLWPKEIQTRLTLALGFSYNLF